MNYFRIAKLFALALGASWLLTGTTQATSLHFEADLDGLQEVPPNVSPAFGFADLTLDDTTGVVTINAPSNYNGLLGGSTAATLNGPAAPGTNAAILFALTLDTAGSNSGPFSGGGTLAAGNIADMINGNTYINISSTVFPGGEIRGQIFSVPEPSTLALGAMAICGLLAVGCQKRKTV